MPVPSINNVSVGVTNPPVDIPANTVYNYSRWNSYGSDPENVIRDNRGVKALQFPSDIGKYYITFSFHDYVRPSVFAPLQLPITDHITLQLPPELQDRHNIEYTVQKEGADGYVVDAVTQGINHMRGLTSTSVNRGWTGTIRDIVSAPNEAVGAFGGLLVAAGASLANRLTLGRGAMQALFGVAPNPFLTVLLDGPNFKRHQFTFQMIARDEMETERIKNIIRTFKGKALPGLKFGGAVYSYPSIVIPKFYPKDEYLYKFKPAVIEDIQVKYSDQVPSFYAGTNAPTIVILTITLLEIELWLDRDFK